MIGIYDYTVILTYLSLLSATAGIALLTGNGDLRISVCLLMLSGLLDGFDGRVARTKKDRTEDAKQFGIQIDSLTDIVAFGVLPAAIGIKLANGHAACSDHAAWKYLLMLPALWYVLAAMIRLAFFNVSAEESRKKHSADHSKVYYTGLPVTTSALLFPLVLLVCSLCGISPVIPYQVVLLLTGFAFVLRFSVPKPGLRMLLAMIGIGAVIIIVALLF